MRSMGAAEVFATAYWRYLSIVQNSNQKSAYSGDTSHQEVDCIADGEDENI
jgi:hypothetical protein